MERDVLTEEECEQLQRMEIIDSLQTAARLGAERERDGCIEAVAGAFPVSATAGSPYARGYDEGVHAALGAIRKRAEAIRRGEEG